MYIQRCRENKGKDGKRHMQRATIIRSGYLTVRQNLKQRVTRDKEGHFVMKNLFNYLRSYEKLSICAMNRVSK